MSEKKPMSVEEILAACRRQDGSGSAAGAGSPPKPAKPASGDTAGGGGGSGEAPASDASAEAPPAKPAGGKPAAEKSGAAKPAAPAKPGQMSVADILAAARAGKAGGSAAGGEAPAPAAPKAAAAKPAAAEKGAAAKGGADKGAAKPATAGAKPALDTSSILAAARGGAKPGPMSKAEAAAAGKAVATSAKAATVVPPMPAKPAYAKAMTAAASADDSRRGFFSTAVLALFGSFMAAGFTLLGLTNLLWVLGLARFFFPNVLIEPPSKFKVGFPTDFAPGTVDERFKAQFGIWVVNVQYEGQQMIVATQTICTHLGCTPNWLEAEQKFKCPCHGSGFYKDGINFEGPAPRPLERYAISLSDDGQLEVDKSKTYQQEMGQWSDPQCFVPV